MELAIEGTLHKKFDSQTFGSGFTKREFVLETEEQYPQKIKFELIKDGCTKLDEHNEGDKLKVHFNVRGREWTSPQDEVKYFVSLNAWRIEKMGGATNDQPIDKEPANSGAIDDDLPF
jgi:hypothetical protein